MQNLSSSEAGGNETSHLSWEETYRAMAAESEGWSDLDIAVGDGVDAQHRLSHNEGE